MLGGKSEQSASDLLIIHAAKRCNGECKKCRIYIVASDHANCQILDGAIFINNVKNRSIGLNSDILCKKVGIFTIGRDVNRIVTFTIDIGKQGLIAVEQECAALLESAKDFQLCATDILT